MTSSHTRSSFFIWNTFYLAHGTAKKQIKPAFVLLFWNYRCNFFFSAEIQTFQLHHFQKGEQKKSGVSFYGITCAVCQVKFLWLLFSLKSLYTWLPSITHSTPSLRTSHFATMQPKSKQAQSHCHSIRNALITSFSLRVILCHPGFIPCDSFDIVQKSIQLWPVLWKHCPVYIADRVHNKMSMIDRGTTAISLWAEFSVYCVNDLVLVREENGTVQKTCSVSCVFSLNQCCSNAKTACYGNIIFPTADCFLYFIISRCLILFVLSYIC